jgi:hypothetical protein
MYAADLECRFMNVDKPPKYVSGFLDEIEKGVVLHSTKDARVYIDKLSKMLFEQSIQLNLYKKLNDQK